VPADCFACQRHTAILHQHGNKCLQSNTFRHTDFPPGLLAPNIPPAPNNTTAPRSQGAPTGHQTQRARGPPPLTTVILRRSSAPHADDHPYPWATTTHPSTPPCQALFATSATCLGIARRICRAGTRIDQHIGQPLPRGIPRPRHHRLPLARRSTRLTTSPAPSVPTLCADAFRTDARVVSSDSRVYVVSCLRSRCLVARRWTCGDPDRRTVDRETARAAGGRLARRTCGPRA
jgi:hypothetical protein